MNEYLTIVSITNSRSTHRHSLKALQDSEDVLCPIEVFRDMPWTDALNQCVDSCKTPLMLRVDDDMIVHPKAVAYMLHRSLQEKNFGLVYFHLWEDCTSRVRQSIKVYNVEALRHVGGFRSDPDTGRVDGRTNGALADAGYPIVEDASVTALHVCGTWDEQKRYEQLWGHRKPNRKAVKAYCGTKTVQQQCDMRKEFLEDLNRKRQTPFAEFIRTFG